MNTIQALSCPSLPALPSHNLRSFFFAALSCPSCLSALLCTTIPCPVLLYHANRCPFLRNPTLYLLPFLDMRCPVSPYIALPHIALCCPALPSVATLLYLALRYAAYLALLCNYLLCTAFPINCPDLPRAARFCPALRFPASPCDAALPCFTLHCAAPLWAALPLIDLRFPALP